MQSSEPRTRTADSLHDIFCAEAGSSGSSGLAFEWAILKRLYGRKFQNNELAAATIKNNTHLAARPGENSAPTDLSRKQTEQRDLILGGRKQIAVFRIRRTCIGYY
jgi:hypothetical protein